MMKKKMVWLCPYLLDFSECQLKLSELSSSILSYSIDMAQKREVAYIGVSLLIQICILELGSSDFQPSVSLFLPSPFSHSFLFPCFPPFLPLSLFPVLPSSLLLFLPFFLLSFISYAMLRPRNSSYHHPSSGLCLLLCPLQPVVFNSEDCGSFSLQI